MEKFLEVLRSQEFLRNSSETTTFCNLFSSHLTKATIVAFQPQNASSKNYTKDLKNNHRIDQN